MTIFWFSILFYLYCKLGDKQSLLDVNVVVFIHPNTNVCTICVYSNYRYSHLKF